MSSMIRKIIRVTGRVQGVFFRVSTQREAQSLGLTGFVRNEPDGSVYIEAEGEEEALQKLLAWIRAGGPPQARVYEVQVVEAPPADYQHFDIK